MESLADRDGCRQHIVRGTCRSCYPRPRAASTCTNHAAAIALISGLTRQYDERHLFCTRLALTYYARPPRAEKHHELQATSSRRTASIASHRSSSRGDKCPSRPFFQRFSSVLCPSPDMLCTKSSLTRATIQLPIPRGVHTCNSRPQRMAACLFGKASRVRARAEFRPNQTTAPWKSVRTTLPGLTQTGESGAHSLPKGSLRAFQLQDCPNQGQNSRQSSPERPPKVPHKRQKGFKRASQCTQGCPKGGKAASQTHPRKALQPGNPMLFKIPV